MHYHRLYCLVRWGIEPEEHGLTISDISDMRLIDMRPDQFANIYGFTGHNIPQARKPKSTLDNVLGR